MTEEEKIEKRSEILIDHLGVGEKHKLSRLQLLNELFFAVTTVQDALKWRETHKVEEGTNPLSPGMKYFGVDLLKRTYITIRLVAADEKKAEKRAMDMAESYGHCRAALELVCPPEEIVDTNP